MFSMGITSPFLLIVFLLGSDSTEGGVVVDPVLAVKPSLDRNTEIPNVYPACVVTRSMSKHIITLTIMFV